MKVLIAGNDEAVMQQIRTILNQNLAEFIDHSVVDLAIAASRAELLHPDLVLVVMGSNPESVLPVVKAINQATSAFMACIGPSSDGKLIIRTLHEGGADQYLDVANLEAELNETLWEIKSRSATGPAQGKVVVLIGASGGCGVSTLAVNTAAVIAKKHHRCALLDFNIASGDLASLLDLHPTQSLSDFCRSLNRIDRSLFDKMFTVHESGIHLLASPRSFGEPTPMNAEALRQAVVMSRSVFPFVVVDLNLDRGLHEVEEAVLRMADHVLVVFRLEFTSLRNVRRTIERLDRLGIDRNRLDFVANRFGQPHDVPRAMAESVIGFKIAHFIPNDASSINRANNDGTPLVTMSAWSTVSRSIYSMVTSLNGQAEPVAKAGHVEPVTKVGPVGAKSAKLV